jgi:hypothetical protein
MFPIDTYPYSASSACEARYLIVERLKADLIFADIQLDTR